MEGSDESNHENAAIGLAHKAKSDERPSTTPPSSPPVKPKAGAMPPPSRPASQSRKRKQSDTASIETSQSIVQLASHDKADHPQQTPPSAQRPAFAQPEAISSDKKSTKTVSTPSEQNALDASAGGIDNAPGLSEMGEPDEPMGDFDWEELQRRYHSRLSELNQEEQVALRDFDQLLNYFSLWARCGSRKEDDRSYKRLKTQVTYIQNEEAQLEQKRHHYVRVVDAFKSALQLLSG